MKYLDAHSGSLQVLSSVVLVMVTIVYTVLTMSMARAAREALRPYVYLDLSFLSPARMVIVVGNSGTKVAGKVTVTLTGSNREKLGCLYASYRWRRASVIFPQAVPEDMR